MIIYLKMDLALYNLQRLMCSKPNQPTNILTNMGFILYIDVNELRLLCIYNYFFLSSWLEPCRLELEKIPTSSLQR